MIGLTNALLAAAAALEANADELTRLDSLQGDGDLGRTAGLIAAALRDAAEREHTVAALQAAGSKIAATAPSSSGTLIASAFLASAKAIQADEASSLVSGLGAGVDGIRRRGKAEAGDRTMLDALVPALLSLERDATDLTAAAVAAEQGVEATKTMRAKFGRARFLAGNAVGEPDPGAVMVGVALAAALRAG